MLLQSNFPTIVMLHYVSDNPAYNDLKPWNINTASYIRLLDYLEQYGYNTIGFEDLSNKMTGNKNIIITFDDCPRHLWGFAIPELQKRNMKAVFYIPTAHIGGYNEWNVIDGKPRIELMDEDDIARLIEAGMEVGSHAHNHIMLEENDDAEVLRQLTLSKSILESIIKKPVLSMAYPYGSLPRGYRSMAETVGYMYCLGVYVPWQSGYSIRRWIFDDTDTTKSIQWKMSGMYNWYRAWQDKKEYYSKTILRKGYNLYAKMKERIKAGTVVAFSFTWDVPCAEWLVTIP